jgi:Ca-activated chloride channel family protein
LVTLSVTVEDSQGRFVTGLAREHFHVYDNGEPQPIELFTAEAVPATIGLVIDCSGSMRGRRDDVTAAVTAFAGISHPLDEIFTIHFNEAVWPGLTPGLVATHDPQRLRALLSAAPARGMTALYDAVDRAADYVRIGTRDRRILIVVADGGDNASVLSLDVVLEHVRRVNAVVYSVALVDPDDREARPQVLRRLARETGGDVFTPRRADGVMEAFVRIAQEIRSGYTIGFTPPETAEGFRPIRVVVDAGDRRQLVARTRPGYRARPSKSRGR